MKQLLIILYSVLGISNLCASDGLAVGLPLLRWTLRRKRLTTSYESSQILALHVKPFLSLLNASPQAAHTNNGEPLAANTT